MPFDREGLSASLMREVQRLQERIFALVDKIDDISATVDLIQGESLPEALKAAQSLMSHWRDLIAASMHFRLFIIAGMTVDGSADPQGAFDRLIVDEFRTLSGIAIRPDSRESDPTALRAATDAVDQLRSLIADHTTPN